MAKIVNWKEFSEMPPGTVYWQFSPDIFYNPGIVVKFIDHGDGPNDFFYINLDPEMDRLPGGGEAVFVSESCGRWGEFDYDAKFCVLDQDDINVLIRRLCGDLE